ncbi:hypothetical protein DEMA109039_12130 [Deinococcus marmoris]
MLLKPVPEGAVADLVMVLDAIHEAGRFQGVGGSAARVFLAGHGPELALVFPAPVDHLRQFGGAALKAAVIALLFAGQGHAHFMVEVVHPDAVQTMFGDHFRDVAVVLGQQQMGAPQFMNLRRQLLQDMQRAVVLHGGGGVQAQAIEAVLVEPHQRVASHVAAHVDLGVIQAHAPGAGKALGKVAGAVAGQIIARRTKMVVHHVQQHAQTQPVRGVDEGHQLLGPSVGRVRRVHCHAVVAPAALAVVSGQRHHLNGRDAQLLQVRQLFLRGPVCSFGCKGADVQLIEHALVQRNTVPVGVLPLIGVGMVHLGLAVYAVWQEAGVGIGHFRAVQHEQVACARADGQNRLEKAVAQRGHGVQRAVHFDLNSRGRRRPDPETRLFSAGQQVRAQPGFGGVMGQGSDRGRGVPGQVS